MRIVSLFVLAATSGLVACGHTSESITSGAKLLATCAEFDRAGALEQNDLERCAHEELRAGRNAEASGAEGLALYRYQRALFYAPDLAGAHNAAGEVLLSRGELESACSSFATALAYDGANAAARRNLSRCALELGAAKRAAAIASVCTSASDLDCWCAHGSELAEEDGPVLPQGLSRSTLARECPQMRTVAVERCEDRLAAGDCEGAAQACHGALSAWPENQAALRAWRRAQACLVASVAEEGVGEVRLTTAVGQR